VVPTRLRDEYDLANQFELRLDLPRLSRQVDVKHNQERNDGQQFKNDDDQE